MSLSEIKFRTAWKRVGVFHSYFLKLLHLTRLSVELINGDATDLLLSHVKPVVEDAALFLQYQHFSLQLVDDSYQRAIAPVSLEQTTIRTIIIVEFLKKSKTLVQEYTDN